MLECQGVVKLGPLVTYYQEYLIGSNQAKDQLIINELVTHTTTQQFSIEQTLESKNTLFIQSNQYAVFVNKTTCIHYVYSLHSGQYLGQIGLSKKRSLYPVTLYTSYTTDNLFFIQCEDDTIYGLIIRENASNSQEILTVTKPLKYADIINPKSATKQANSQKLLHLKCHPILPLIALIYQQGSVIFCSYEKLYDYYSRGGSNNENNGDNNNDDDEDNENNEESSSVPASSNKSSLLRRNSSTSKIIYGKDILLKIMIISCPTSDELLSWNLHEIVPLETVDLSMIDLSFNDTGYQCAIVWGQLLIAHYDLRNLTSLCMNKKNMSSALLTSSASFLFKLIMLYALPQYSYSKSIPNQAEHIIQHVFHPHLPCLLVLTTRKDTIERNKSDIERLPKDYGEIQPFVFPQSSILYAFSYIPTSNILLGMYDLKEINESFLLNRESSLDLASMVMHITPSSGLLSFSARRIQLTSSASSDIPCEFSNVQFQYSFNYSWIQSIGFEIFSQPIVNSIAVDPATYLYGLSSLSKNSVMKRITATPAAVTQGRTASITSANLSNSNASNAIASFPLLTNDKMKSILPEYQSAFVGNNNNSDINNETNDSLISTTKRFGFPRLFGLQPHNQNTLEYQYDIFEIDWANKISNTPNGSTNSSGTSTTSSTKSDQHIISQYIATIPSYLLQKTLIKQISGLQIDSKDIVRIDSEDLYTFYPTHIKYLEALSSESEGILVIEGKKHQVEHGLIEDIVCVYLLATKEMIFLNYTTIIHNNSSASSSMYVGLTSSGKELHMFTWTNNKITKLPKTILLNQITNNCWSLSQQQANDSLLLEEIQGTNTQLRILANVSSITTDLPAIDTPKLTFFPNEILEKVIIQPYVKNLTNEKQEKISDLTEYLQCFSTSSDGSTSPMIGILTNQRILMISQSMVIVQQILRTNSPLSSTSTIRAQHYTQSKPLFSTSTSSPSTRLTGWTLPTDENIYDIYWLGSTLLLYSTTGRVFYLLPFVSVKRSDGQLASTRMTMSQMKTLQAMNRVLGKGIGSQLGLKGQSSRGPEALSPIGLVMTLPRNRSKGYGDQPNTLTPLILPDRILHLTIDRSPIFWSNNSNRLSVIPLPQLYASLRPFNPFECLTLGLWALHSAIPTLTNKSLEVILYTLSLYTNGSNQSHLHLYAPSRDYVHKLITMDQLPVARSYGRVNASSGSTPSGSATLAKTPSLTNTYAFQLIQYLWLTHTNQATSYPNQKDFPEGRWLSSSFRSSLYLFSSTTQQIVRGFIELLSEKRSHLIELLLNDQDQYGGNAMPVIQSPLSDRLLEIAQYYSSTTKQNIQVPLTFIARLLDISGDYLHLFQLLTQDPTITAMISKEILPNKEKINSLREKLGLTPMELHSIQRMYLLKTNKNLTKGYTQTQLLHHQRIKSLIEYLSSHYHILSYEEETSGGTNNTHITPVSSSEKIFKAFHEFHKYQHMKQCGILGSYTSAYQFSLIADDYLEDFMLTSLTLEKGKQISVGFSNGTMDSQEDTSVQTNYFGDEFPSHWVDNIGKGKELDKIVGYYRCSDGYVESDGDGYINTSSPSTVMTLVDLSKHEKSPLELFYTLDNTSTCGYHIDMSHSNINGGEKHESMKLLCDIIHQNSSYDLNVYQNQFNGINKSCLYTSGLRVHIPRGTPMDIGLYHKDSNRNKLTIEFSLSLASTSWPLVQAYLQKYQELVVVQRVVSGEGGPLPGSLSLWKVYFNMHGKLCVSMHSASHNGVIEATSFTLADLIHKSEASAEPSVDSSSVHDHEDGNEVIVEESYQHFVFILDATHATCTKQEDISVSANDYQLQYTKDISVQILVNCTPILTGSYLPSPIKESQLANTMFYMFPNIHGSPVQLKLTEIRIWAEHRRVEELKQQSENCLSLAEKRYRLQSQLKGTKKLFGAYKPLVLPMKNQLNKPLKFLELVKHEHKDNNKEKKIGGGLVPPGGVGLMAPPVPAGGLAPPSGLAIPGAPGAAGAPAMSARDRRRSMIGNKGGASTSATNETTSASIQPPVSQAPVEPEVKLPLPPAKPAKPTPVVPIASAVPAPTIATSKLANLFESVPVEDKKDSFETKQTPSTVDGFSSDFGSDFANFDSSFNTTTSAALDSAVPTVAFDAFSSDKPFEEKPNPSDSFEPSSFDAFSTDKPFEKPNASSAFEPTPVAAFDAFPTDKTIEEKPNSFTAFEPRSTVAFDSFSTDKPFEEKPKSSDNFEPTSGASFEDKSKQVDSKTLAEKQTEIKPVDHHLIQPNETKAIMKPNELLPTLIKAEHIALTYSFPQYWADQFFNKYLNDSYESQVIPKQCYSTPLQQIKLIDWDPTTHLLEIELLYNQSSKLQDYNYISCQLLLSSDDFQPVMRNQPIHTYVACTLSLRSKANAPVFMVLAYESTFIVYDMTVLLTNPPEDSSIPLSLPKVLRLVTPSTLTFIQYLSSELLLFVTKDQGYTLRTTLELANTSKPIAVFKRHDVSLVQDNPLARMILDIIVSPERWTLVSSCLPRSSLSPTNSTTAPTPTFSLSSLAYSFSLFHTKSGKSIVLDAIGAYFHPTNLLLILWVKPSSSNDSVEFVLTEYDLNEVLRYLTTCNETPHWTYEQAMSLHTSEQCKLSWSVSFTDSLPLQTLFSSASTILIHMMIVNETVFLVTNHGYLYVIGMKVHKFHGRCLLTSKDLLLINNDEPSLSNSSLVLMSCQMEKPTPPVFDANVPPVAPMFSGILYHETDHTMHSFKVNLRDVALLINPKRQSFKA